jgi:glycosyltransferase involved in cell wall biosynthesis
MRILHTEWSDDMGGQEKRVLAEMVGLRRRGHYVAIACRGHAKIRAEAEGLGIKTHILPFRRPYDIESIFRLIRLIQRERFEIVNTHSGVDSWVGGLSARLARAPVLVRTRHLNIPLRRNPLNFIHYLPDMYITCGDDMRMRLIKDCGFPEDRVISIPTGVDREFFEVRRDKRRAVRYGLSKDSPVIVNVGILRSVKGHEVTFRAVRTVIERVPDARFLIVGDGPARERLERMVDDLDIRKYVIFTGFVRDITEIYSLSDIAILSSWSEGLPQSLTQAMAAGVPVVATAVGGVPEVVIHEQTGLLVEAGDSQGLARGVIKLLEDPGLCRRLAEKAKQHVMDRYTMDHMIESIEALYIELLKRKGHDPSSLWPQHHHIPGGG